MMRQLVLLAVVGLTVAQYDTTCETYFEPGKQYVYKYETQVVNGVPEQSRVFSILKIRSHVRLHLQTRAQFLVKLEKIDVGRLNGRLEEVDPVNEQVPHEMLESINEPELANMRQCLTKPFKFTYHKGLIVDLYIDPMEPDWCQNIKRGVANMFQVNLDKTKSIDQEETSWSSRSFSTSKENSYRVMETSPSGECEALYSVHEPEIQSSRFINKPLLQVDKVRNYENCVVRPVFLFSSIDGKRCTDCKPETVNPLKSTTNARIIISGDRTRFAIQSVVLESKHIFQPYAETKTNAYTIVNQTLYLKQCHSQGIQIPEPVNTRRTSLIVKSLNLEKELLELQKQEETLNNPLYTARKVLKAKQYLEAVVEELKNPNMPIDIETPEVISALVTLLRNMTQSEISQLYSQSSSLNIQSSYPVTPEFVKHTLLRILAMTGTPAAISVFVNKLQIQPVPIPVAVELISACALHVYSPPAIQKLMQLEKSSYVSQSKVFKRTFYLTIGSTVHKMNRTIGLREFYLGDSLRKLDQLQQTAPHQQWTQYKLRLTSVLRTLQSARKQVEQEYFTMIEKLLQSPREQEKIIAIKSLGNCGLKKVIELLKPIILSEPSNKILRLQSIYSLKRVAKVFYNMVTEVCLPIYLDQSQPEELRIAAYSAITHGEPQYHVWQILAQALKNETNVQVGSYVYRHLMAYSNSTYPCFASIAKNASLALNWAKPHHDATSRVIHLPLYNSEYKAGVSLDLETVGSPRSYLPRAASVKLHVNRMGFNAEVFEAGYSSEGLENIIDKLSDWNSFFKNPAQNSYIKEMKEQLKIKNRYVPSETNGLMYMKLLGNEISFYEMEPDHLLSLVSQSQIEFKRASPYMMGQIIYNLPTECGLPINAQLQALYIVKLNGHIQTNAAQLLSVSQLTANFNLKPTIQQHFVGFMSVDLSLFDVGMGSRMFLTLDNVKLQGDVSLDKSSKKIKSSFSIPQKEQIMVKAESKAVVYFMNSQIYSSDSKMMPEYRSLVASDTLRVEPIKFTVPAKVLGAKITIAGERPACKYCFTPFNFIASRGRNLFIVKYTPVSPVEKIQFTAQYVSSRSSFQQSYETVQQPEFMDLTSTPVSIESLISKLKPELVPESYKCGFCATLETIKSSERKPLIQIQKLCQISKIRNIKAQCTSLLTRVPWFSNEVQNWKALVRTEFEIPRETISFKELLTPEYQQQVTQTLNFVKRQDALRENHLEWIKAQKIAMWERWVKNITYEDKSYFEEYTPLMLSYPEQQSSILNPSAKELLEALNEIIQQQADLSSQLLHLRSISVSHSSPWSPWSQQNTQIVTLISQVKSSLLIVTTKLQIIKPRLQMLTSLQSSKYSLIRITSKLHAVLQHQTSLIYKYKYVVIKPLEVIYPSIKSLEIECQTQKVLLNEITQLMTVLKEQSWYTTSTRLEEEPLKKFSQIQQIMVEPEYRDIPRLMKKQMEIGKIIHKTLRINRKNPLPTSTLLQKIVEVMQKYEEIEREIKLIVSSTLQLQEPITEESVKTLNREQVQKAAVGLVILPLQEMILEDTVELMWSLYFRPDAPTPQINELKKKRTDKLFTTLDITARCQQVLKFSTRRMWKIAPEELIIPSLPRTMSGYVIIHYGIGVPNKLISAKFAGMKSIEQLWWELKQVSVVTRDPMIQKLLRLEAEGSSNPEYEKLVEEVEEELNRMRGWRLSVKYPPTMRSENQYVCTVLDQAVNFIKYLAFGKLDVVVPKPEEVRRGLINAWLNLRTSGRTFDFMLVKPSEAIKIKEIPVPFLLKYGLPSYSYSSYKPATQGVCSIFGNKVRTFDRHFYTLPSTFNPTCEKVVTVDCSDKNALAVTIRKESTSLKTVVRVILNGHKIDLYPSAISPYATIDGRTIILQESVTLRQPISYFGSQHIELIRHKDTIILYVPSIHFKVKAVSNKVFIEPSRYFRTRLCGLCGNYDLDTRRELQDPSLYIHEKPESFSVSYLLKSSSCPISQYQNLYKPSIRYCNIQYKHDIISSGFQTCVSVKQQPKCESPCVNKETQSKVVRYYCAPSDQQSTRDLVALARIQPIHNLEQKITNFVTQLVYQPTSCKPQL